MALTFSLVSFLGILCFRFSKKKISFLVSFLIIAFMAFVFANLQWTDDSFAYSSVYKIVCSGEDLFSMYSSKTIYGIDFGFLVLMKFFSFVHFDYTFFRLAVFLLSFLFILISSYLLSDHLFKREGSLIFVALYLVFPFAYDCYQIEFFLAYSIILFGLVCLIINKKRSHCIYLVCLAIATFIHLYCLPFAIFAFFKSNKRKIPWIIAIIVTIMVLINFVLKISPIEMLLILFPRFNAFNTYSNDKLNPLTVLMSIVTFVVIGYYSFLVKDFSKKTRSIFVMNIISMVFLPFIFSSLNFERYLRPLLIINYVLIFNTIRTRKITIKEKLVFASIVFLLLFRFSVTFIDLLLKYDLFNPSSIPLNG